MDEFFLFHLQQGSQKAKAGTPVERCNSFNKEKDGVSRTNPVQRYHSARITPTMSEAVPRINSKSNGQSSTDLPVILKPLITENNGNIAKINSVSQPQATTLEKSRPDSGSQGQTKSRKQMAPKPPQASLATTVAVKPDMTIAPVVDDKQKQIVLTKKDDTANNSDKIGSGNSSFSVKLRPVPTAAKSYEHLDKKVADPVRRHSAQMNITLKSTKNSKNGSVSEWQDCVDAEPVPTVPLQMKSTQSIETTKDQPNFSGKKTAVVNPTCMVNQNRNKVT